MSRGNPSSALPDTYESVWGGSVGWTSGPPAPKPPSDYAPATGPTAGTQPPITSTPTIGTYRP